MTADEVKAISLGLPGTTEEHPFGEEVTVFKVAGKVFGVCRLDAEPMSVSLRCEPELAEQLRAAHAAIAPGWHLNKKHWNTVTLDGSLPDAMIRDMIEDSWDLVVEGMPRARRRALRLADGRG